MKNSMRLDANGNPTQVASVIAAETIDGTSASTKSTFTGDDDGLLIRIKAVDTDIWYKLGIDPTATTEGTSVLLSSGETEYIMLQPDETIAAYGGKLNIGKCY